MHSSVKSQRKHFLFSQRFVFKPGVPVSPLFYSRRERFSKFCLTKKYCGQVTKTRFNNTVVFVCLEKKKWAYSKPAYFNQRDRNAFHFEDLKNGRLVTIIVLEVNKNLTFIKNYWLILTNILADVFSNTLREFRSQHLKLGDVWK